MRGQLPGISPSSGAFRATFPPRGKAFRRGEVTPPYGAIQIHRAVGAGHAPPATIYYNELTGRFVGAAYMPPVAATPANRPNGKTARDATMRPLHSYPKKGFFTKNAAPRAAYLILTLNSPLLTLKKGRSFLRNCVLFCFKSGLCNPYKTPAK